MFQPIPLTEMEREELLALLGGPENLSVQDEGEFTQQSGCPPEEMEAWLDEKWVSCDIQAVLAKTQRVEFEPVLLTRRDEDRVLARLFYPKKEPAVNAVEAGITEVWNLLVSGRLKVMASLSNWFREFRKYHRDDKGSGKIVKHSDHLMDATRYLIVSGRPLMRTKPEPRPRIIERDWGPRYTGPQSWMA
jgi:hypothetical protein